MDITIHQTLLPHDDADASLAFYRDTLGFEVRNDVEYAGMHWITVGPPLTSPARRSFCTRPRPLRHHRRRAPHIAEMMAKGTYASINLATTDLDATFEHLQAGDAEVVQEPVDQPYGIRDCAFRDPAGNLIRIQELARVRDGWRADRQRSAPMTKRTGSSKGFTAEERAAMRERAKELKAEGGQGRR